jgi:hypothetical protein
MTGSTIVPGTVKSVVPADSLHPSETAEILIDGADAKYNIVSIENISTAENPQRRLTPGAKVAVTISQAERVRLTEP